MNFLRSVSAVSAWSLEVIFAIQCPWYRVVAQVRLGSGSASLQGTCPQGFEKGSWGLSFGSSSRSLAPALTCHVLLRFSLIWRQSCFPSCWTTSCFYCSVEVEASRSTPLAVDLLNCFRNPSTISALDSGSWIVRWACWSSLSYLQALWTPWSLPVSCWTEGDRRRPKPL